LNQEEDVKLNFLFVLTVVLGLASAQTFAEDYKAKVKASMDYLKSKCPVGKIEGTSVVSGKTVPTLFCGTAKVNNVFDIVTDVKDKHSGTATFFVKSGEDFIRVSTNVMLDGESRAIGTPLAKNAAHAAILKGESFFGQVDILGTPYETGYTPLKDASGAIIGIYYVGYPLK